MIELSQKIRKSEKVGDLLRARAKAQLAYETVVRTRENSYTGSKYADLQDLMTATKKALIDNDLDILQLPIEDLESKTAGTVSTLTHFPSEQFIEIVTVLPATSRGSGSADKFDAQSIGGAQTYSARYAYRGLASVVGEDDDDGNALADKSQETANPPRPKQVKAPEVNRAAAKSDSNAQRPKDAPAPSKAASQTNDPASSGDSGVPKAVIPSETPVAPSQVETTSATHAILTPPEKVSPSADISESRSSPTGTAPTKTQFDGYTARAMALKQPLEKAGLKPSKNLTTGAKLKAFLLSTTGVKELTELTNESWEKFLTETEEAVKVNAGAVVARINALIEGGKVE